MGCLGFLWEFLDRIYVTSQWKHSLAVAGTVSPAGRAKGKNGLQSCFQHSAVTRTIEHLCNRQSSLHVSSVGSILAVLFLQFADISSSLSTTLCTRGSRVEVWWKSKENLSRPSGDFPLSKGRLVLKFPVILFSPAGGRTMMSSQC